MESVRKGKGLREEWEQTMKEHNVPDWYIWSCKKIKYMFPESPCGGLCDDGVPYRLVQSVSAAGILRSVFQYPRHGVFLMRPCAWGETAWNIHLEHAI